VALLSSLYRFRQLRSLELGGVDFPPASLAAALDSLPSLTALTLESYEWERNKTELLPPLYRLCSTQLDHLTIDRRLLSFLIHHRTRPPIRHLRSLLITPVHYDTHRSDESLMSSHDGWRMADTFPSLQHLTVRCSRFLHMLEFIQPPPLSSLTVHVATGVNLSHVSTRTVCLCFEQEEGRVGWRKAVGGAPSLFLHIQHLSISVKRNNNDRRYQVFSPHAEAGPAMTQLTYLDFLHGLTLADLTFLLTASSPPAFAAQLTHLALRVHWQDRAAAATLLPSLASTYPSLTHVHVGVQSAPSAKRLALCSAWEEAVRAVRVAVGPAWCASVADVALLREDVAWRREVGLPTEV